MEIETKIDKECAEITIKLKRRIGKRMERIVITDPQARKLLLEKHPELNIPELSKKIETIDNEKRDSLEATWVFEILQENTKPEKKVTKKEKNILNFKPKSAKVVETTQPEADQVKGVQEPTE